MNTFGLTMAYRFITFLWLLVLVFSSCKKDEETNASTSNIGSAPQQISQSFDVDVTIENNKVAKVIWKTGVTEFSKTTYRYTTDTIFETQYELGKRSFLRKHRQKDGLITSTLDSSFARDTVSYIRFITYEYIGTEMSRMTIEHHDIQELVTKITTTIYDYLYKDNNIFDLSYESSNKNDSTNCSDRFTHYSYTADIDVKNILGVSEGSISKNLKSKSTHLIGCNNNGPSGSTTYEYWYNINEDKRITELVYQKNFNGTSQAFKENYKYIFR